MLRLAGQLKNVDLGASPRWAALMRQNSVDPARLNVPIFVAQGSADAIVTPEVTRVFVNKLCIRCSTRWRSLFDGVLFPVFSLITGKMSQRAISSALPASPAKTTT
jgi:hypothetical protein